MATLPITDAATIYKYVKTVNKTWRYCKAVLRNGKLVPHLILEPNSTIPVTNETGTYYASEGGKWHRLSNDPVEAEKLFKWNIAQNKLAAAQAAVAALQGDAAQNEMTLAQAVQAYKDDVQRQIDCGSKKPKTLSAITAITSKLLTSIDGGTLLTDVTREMLLDFIASIAKSSSRVTASNYFIYVSALLKWCGITLFKKGDAPRSPKSKKVRCYEPKELDTLFGISSEYHKIVWETLWKSGLREEELTYLNKNDVIKLEDGWVLRVEAKEGWTTKCYEERQVRIPETLGLSLVEFAKRYQPKSKILFPTSKGTRNFRLLRALKSDCRQAKLDETQFKLHYFRSTFATTLLRAGMNIADVKRQLGHAPNSNTIFKYLAAAQGGAMSKEIENVWAAKY